MEIVEQIDKIEQLLKGALLGESEHWILLGEYYRKGIGGVIDYELSKLCYQHGIKLGSHKAFVGYHQYYSIGKEVIDDDSYMAIAKEYKKLIEQGIHEQKITSLIELGTDRQKSKYLKVGDEDLS